MSNVALKTDISGKWVSVEEVNNQLNILEGQIQSAKTRLDSLEKENAALRELVHHLASRPAPHMAT